MTNTWALKYLVHSFPCCNTTLPHNCRSKFWLMNHVSASNDSTLMSFPMSSCIVIVFILSVLLNSAAPRLAKINTCLTFVGLYSCVRIWETRMDPSQQTIPHSTLPFSSSHHIISETFQGVLAKSECSTCSPKVEGSGQEFQTATAANLGETCHCHLLGYMSQGECDLCQARR